MKRNFMGENFTTYHPAISFIYFLTVIVLSVIIMNPVFLCVSLMCAFMCAVCLKGAGAVRLVFPVLILIVLSMVVNPLVNHSGMSVLFMLPADLGPVTWESVVYGFTTGLMIGSVIMWFVSFNIIITSDKLIFLFGKILPGSSLIFVMILRFIPRYNEQIKKISEAQRAIGMGTDTGSLKTKIKNGARILSIMFTWAVENAIQTADSMKSRGYGIKDRTSYMIYKFTFDDKVMLLAMAVFTTGIIFSCTRGAMTAAFFPFLQWAFTGDDPALPVFMIAGCICFTLLALIPLWSGIRESVYWNKLEKSGIGKEIG